ncbi:CU044_5270 family protein [Amycolatopsis sp. NPDC005232]|uniref:CU044_5270 family protein n=1 Tax=Amycolatopsis sp. NPDC005232 TaxID=3157027 RepID=UPI0033B1D1B3
MNELDETLAQLHRDARSAPGSLDNARRNLMAAVDAESARPGNGEVVALRPRRRRVLPIAAAAAAVLALAAVGIQLGAPSGTPGSTSGDPGQPAVVLLSASQVLTKAADLSVGAVDQPVGPGQYRYIVQHGWVQRSVEKPPVGGKPVGYSYLWETRTQRWIPADYRDTWQENRTVLDKSKFLAGSAPQSQDPVPDLGPYDQGQWRGACGDFFPKVKPVKVCGDANDWDSPTFYAKLPRDPGQLYAFLTDLTKVRGSAPDVMFHYGVEILRAGLMPADLRAQWYRALAKIPGIQVVDRTTDLDGRSGTAIGLGDEHEQDQLVIDQATGAMIGTRVVAGTQPDFPWIKPGTELETTAISTAVVNGLGKTPA